MSTSKRYKKVSGYSIQEVVDQVTADYGHIDYLVHSLANGPEVTKALLDTSRAGYLSAVSSSAYSLVSMVSRFAPIMRPGQCISMVVHCCGTAVSSLICIIVSFVVVLYFHC